MTLQKDHRAVTPRLSVWFLGTKDNISELPDLLHQVMVKVLTGAGETLRGRMLLYDALYAETRTITLAPRADCEICGAAYAEARRPKHDLVDRAGDYIVVPPEVWSRR